MKGIKKFWIMLLCVSMLVGVLSACKGTDNDLDAPNTNGDVQTPTGDEPVEEMKEIDFSEHIEFSYWLYATPNDYYSDYSENPVVQYLNDKFNMTLKVQQPSSGTEEEALNIMLATGEHTDLIDTTQYSVTASVNQLYEDGVIIDIAEYLDYMPNFSQLLEENETFRKNTYNDDGRILGLTSMSTSDIDMWGGLVYRHDILEAMTGGNVQFPSGNDAPTTLEDWDYMLPLMKQYFEAAGMVDYAVLILPATGVFPTNDLIGTFDTHFSYYLDNGSVKFGPMEDGYYEYLKKMNAWYREGYIYGDFPSRRNDMFFLPNTALTYGGAAGIWFGLVSQLGEAMSMPEYGLHMDVRALRSPIDAANGKTTAYSNELMVKGQEEYGSVAVASTCEDIERLLTTLDHMYSYEGSLLRSYGLNAEQAQGIDLYERHGLTEGGYTIADDGTFKYNENFVIAGADGTVDQGHFIGLRLPSLRQTEFDAAYIKELEKAASDTWTAYQSDDIRLPKTLTTTATEDATLVANTANINTYVDEMVLKFIIGIEALNEENWSNFTAQLEAYGIHDNIAIKQAAYERYLVR